jgi:hypothetical protein
MKRIGHLFIISQSNCTVLHAHISGLAWLAGALALVCLSHHGGKALAQFAGLPILAWCLVQIGLAGIIYCLFRAVRCAFLTRSAVAVFISSVLSIFGLIAFKLPPPRAPRILTRIAVQVAELFVFAPVQIERRFILSYIFLLLIGLAVPIATMITVIALLRWKRADDQMAGVAHRGPSVSDVGE